MPPLSIADAEIQARVRATAVVNELQRYEVNPVRASRTLYELQQNDPAAFGVVALRLLSEPCSGPGYRRLLELVLEHDILLDALCDREQWPMQEAVRLLRAASQLDSLVDARLLRNLLNRLGDGDESRDHTMVREVLAVFDAAGMGARLSTMLVQLLREQNPQVRSKVAILFGRGQCRVDWAASDRDPRVRANAIEALWGVDRPANRRLLWKSVHDPHNRVAGNAILGLLRLNDRGVVGSLRKMAAHPSSTHRATAAWVIGQSGNPELLPILRGMRDDPEENVRRNVERSLRLLEPPSQPVVTPAEEAAPAERSSEPPAAEAPETEAPRDAASGRYVRTRGMVLDRV